MAWERRARGGRYYTRSQKVAGRVIRHYVGTGPLAEWVAACDEEDRRQREELRARRKEAAAAMANVDALVRLADEAAELAARAALEAAGYRQHNRGDWRRRRDRG
jgi:hypothetical protein